MNWNNLSSLAWLLGIGALFYWMMRKGGCGMHSGHSNGGGHQHGGGHGRESGGHAGHEPPGPRPCTTSSWSRCGSMRREPTRRWAMVVSVCFTCLLVVGCKQHHERHPGHNPSDAANHGVSESGSGDEDAGVVARAKVGHPD